jgi:hypothetical protein
VSFDGEPRDQAVHGGVRLDLGRVEEEFFTPDQPGLHAQLHYPFEESPKDLKSIALADLGEARVVGQRLLEIVCEVPPQAQTVGHDLHQLALRAQILKEKNQL